MSECYMRLYDEQVIEWVEHYENYIYNWPDTRKEKLIIGKRQRFAEYLNKKMGNK
jgi:hypothetical protein